MQKDALGRDIITADGRPPSVPNLPVKVVTPAGTKDGYMNGNTAVITDRK
jgi:hypothetical protein